MYSDDQEDTRQYNIVVNHEEQYSIYFADREPPLGWSIVPIPESWKDEYRKSLNGEIPEGNKQECLMYIKEIWTDMRPLSLRKQMAEAGY